jgi:hypothetical protein
LRVDEPARDGLGDDKDTEHEQEHEDHRRDEQDLQPLAEQEDQSDVAPLPFRQRRRVNALIRAASGTSAEAGVPSTRPTTTSHDSKLDSSPISRGNRMTENPTPIKTKRPSTIRR